MTTELPASRPVASWMPFTGIVAVLSLLLTTAFPASAQTGHSPIQADEASPVSARSYDQDWIMAPIQPSLRQSILEYMPEGLPRYVINVALDTSAVSDPTLSGSLQLTWTNTTGEAASSLPFRLFANGPAEDGTAQTISDVTVNGEPTDVELTESDSVATVALGTDLAPGDTVAIGMNFTAALPIDSRDHYGIFGYDSRAGTWALAHWYPVIAGRDPVTGWVLDHPSVNGDPIFTDTALYDVTVTTEEGWLLATTGVEFGEAVTPDADTTARRFVSGPARDFTIVADEDFEVVTRDIGGVTVNSWFNPGEQRVASAIADYTAQSVELFSDLLFPYPFVEIDILPVQMHGAAGCEFSQLIYMASDYYGGGTNLSVPNQLDFTVAHEVVHQWFYGLVGNNQYAHAFIDEGITNYLSAQVYFERQYGEDVAADVIDRYIRSPFESSVRRDQDAIVDQPTDGFDPDSAYVFAAYAKAPLGFEAIRAEIGDDAFFGALAAYVDQHVFLVAQPAQLLDAFEQASGKDLEALWENWFEETNGEAELP